MSEKETPAAGREGSARAQRLARALADLARARVNNALGRMVVCAVAALLATIALGGWSPVIWFIVVLPTLIVERRVMAGLARACAAGEPPRLGRMIAWTAFQSIVGNGLGVLLWFQEPRHGDTLAAYFFAGSALNALLTLRAHTPLLLAALGPTVAYMVGAPLADFFMHGRGVMYVDLAPLVALLLFGAHAFYAWRTLRVADEAHVRADTALRSAQRAAKDAAGARAEFIGVMREELRTPTATLASASEALRQLKLPAEARLHVDTLIDSGEVLAAVLDDLVDLENLASGRVRLEPRPADPRALLKTTVAAFRAPAHEKGLELFLDIAEDAPAAVMLDPVRLRQVLFNLLSNAVKFTQTGGVRVRLQTAPAAKEGHVRLAFSVADTGVGMTRAALALALGERRAAPGQHGLGLAISVKLARLMQAKLTARSAPEQGSLFSLVLEAPLIEQAAAEPPKARPPSVLIVQDSAGERRMLSAIFEATALKVAIAESGARAFDMLQAQRFDLVLADQRMIECDAIDLVSALRAGGPNAGTPVIALVEAGDHGARALCAESGVDGAVAAPYTAAALLGEVARVLGAPPPAANWAA